MYIIVPILTGLMDAQLIFVRGNTAAVQSSVVTMAVGDAVMFDVCHTHITKSNHTHTYRSFISIQCISLYPYCCCVVHLMLVKNTLKL